MKKYERRALEWIIGRLDLMDLATEIEVVEGPNSMSHRKMISDFPPPRDLIGQIQFLMEASKKSVKAWLKEEYKKEQAVTDYGINWEDPHLHCDDCGKRIESAYAEEQ